MWDDILNRRVLRDAAKDQGSGGKPDDKKTKSKEDVTETEDTSGADDKGKKGGDGDALPKSRAELETWGDSWFKERAERLRKQWDKELADKQSDEDKKLLADQQKYQELSDRQKQEIDTLKQEKAGLEAQVSNLTAEMKTANTALETYLATMRDGVDPGILELLSSRSLPDQLAWLVKNRDANLGDGGADGGLPRKAPPATPGKPKDGDRRAVTDKDKEEAAGGVRRTIRNHF